MSDIIPRTRDEMLLASVAGNKDIPVDSIIPKTRREMYLAYMAGCSDLSVDDLPEPRTREEILMYQTCCEGGGSSAGGTVADDAVTFIDYDGTVLYTYTEDEIAEMTELPELPTHKGLVGDGWNYDLDTIKSHGKNVTVGALYKTDDGKTRIYITLQEGRTSPMLEIRYQGVLTINWGDGSTPDVFEGGTYNSWYVASTQNHQYSVPGSYVITLEVSEGGQIYIIGNSEDYARSCVLRHSSAKDSRNRGYQVAVTKIELGGHGVEIGLYAFAGLRALKTITMHRGVVSQAVYTKFAFAYCNSLTGIVLPPSFTKLDDSFALGSYSLARISIPYGVTKIGSKAFYENRSLEAIDLPSSVTETASSAFYKCSNVTHVGLHEGLQILGMATFQYCSAVRSVRIPSTVTSIGTMVFAYCSALESLCIPDGIATVPSSLCTSCFALESVVLPDSITAIDSSAFSYCSALKEINFPSGLVTFGEYCFNTCIVLSEINIPEGTASIPNNAFYGCSNIRSLQLPDSLTTIGDSAFASLDGVYKITLPAGTTTLGGNAFSGCFSLLLLDCSKCTAVPTITKSYKILTNQPEDCRIHVPAALYDEWIVAQYWSDFADIIVAV